MTIIEDLKQIMKKEKCDLCDRDGFKIECIIDGCSGFEPSDAYYELKKVIKKYE